MATSWFSCGMPPATPVGGRRDTLATVTFRAQCGRQPLFRLPIAEAAVTRNDVHDPNFGRLDALCSVPDGLVQLVQY